MAPLEVQYEWADDETSLTEGRDTLQKVSVFVFKDALRLEEYSGCSLYDDEIQIICVNNTSAKTRQSFTPFHELAHLLFYTSGIDTLDRYILRLPEQQRRIEILCNRFAAEFLVPEAAFRDAVASRPALGADR